MREHDHARNSRSGRRRFDDEPATVFQKRAGRCGRLPDPDADETPQTGDRWSTWDEAAKGPEPYPDWLVTELAATDRDLGVLKTGKEADVHLLERGVPGTDRACLLAAKRYRASEHRLFHRDAGYLEGRQVRRSRENRAMANRTAVGRQMIAAQWAIAEFQALCALWTAGARFIPYPVQLAGTELLMQFVGTGDGVAAPRLAQLRPDPPDAADLWHQLVEALTVLASAGYAHGDLSEYNLLVHDGRLIVIDLPQVVDVVANPRGPEFLARDVQNATRWFAARGVPTPDPQTLTATLLAEAGLHHLG